MKRFKIINFKYLSCALLLIVAVAAIVFWYMGSQAAYSEEGVHIEADSEADSTLIIGTHLIHLNAINDKLYKIATESASSANQSEKYYKSELADGRWFNITAAYSLSDIMETGIAVDNEEIEALFLTHRTGADGITHDLRTGLTVSIFDIQPIYDLMLMPELKPLKTQYDLMVQAASKDELDQQNVSEVLKFFSETKTQNEETKNLDKQIEALQKYYIILTQNNAARDEMDAVIKVMDKLDSTRRAKAYEMISTQLRALADKIGMQPKSEEESEEQSETQSEEETESAPEDLFYKQDPQLMTAMEDSNTNLLNSRVEAEGNQLDPGSTVMTAYEYDQCTLLANLALQDNHAECDVIIQNLIDLSHIMDAKIVRDKLELSLLQSQLLPKMDEVYKNSLMQGVSPKYKEAVQERSSHVILENILTADTSAYGTYQNELQFYIQSVIDRMDSQASRDYILGRIDKVTEFQSVIPLDEFKNKAEASVQDHLIWLQKLLSLLSGESKNNQMDKLYEEKAVLQEQKLEALDELDLDTSKRMDALMEAKEKEIQELGRKQEAELNRLYEEKASLSALPDQDNSSTKSQIAALEQNIAILSAGLSEGQDAAGVVALKLEAKEIILEGSATQEELGELENKLSGLEAFLAGGSSLAGNAIKELHKDMVTASFLEDKSGYDSLIEKSEEIIGEYSDVIRSSGNITTQNAMKILEQELGSAITSLLNAINQSTGSMGNSGSSDTAGGNKGNSSVSGSDGGGNAVSGDGTGSQGSAESAGNTNSTGSEGGTGSQGSAGSAGNTNSTDSQGSQGSTGSENIAGSQNSTETQGGTENSGSQAVETDHTKEQSNEVGDKTKSYAKMSKEEVTDAVLAVAAMASVGELQGIEELTNSAGSILSFLMNQEETYLFENKTGLNEKAVNVETLADYLGYRYVWNDTKKTAILSKGGQYYKFIAFHTKAIKNGGAEEEMGGAAQYSGVIYIPSDYVYKTFQCSSYAIGGTDYCVIADDAFLAKLEELERLLYEQMQ